MFIHLTLGDILILLFFQLLPHGEYVNFAIERMTF